MGAPRITDVTINRNQKVMQLTNLVERKIFADCYLNKHWQKQILLAVFQHSYFDIKAASKVDFA